MNFRQLHQGPDLLKIANVWDAGSAALVQSLGVGLAAGGKRVGFWTLVEGSATLVWSRIRVGEETIFRQFPVSGRVLAGLELFFAIESR